MRRITAVTALTLLLACSGEPTCDAVDTTTTEASATTTTGPGSSTTTETADCPATGASSEPDGPSVALEQVGEDDGVVVEAAVYPRPDYDGELWSQWGQGVVLPDGRFVSAIGDEGKIDANSFIFEYDPETGQLTRTADVLSAADHEKGDFGYGKIHAQLRLDPCGTVWGTTYWGSQRGVEYGGSYTGDLLLRYDPDTHALEKVAVPVEHHGVPSLAAWFAGDLLYMEAADPTQPQDDKGGAFVVWDLGQGKVVFEDEADDHTTFRNILVDASGRAFFAAGPGKLRGFDPATNSLTDGLITIPGGVLRASTLPGPDGSVYGVTQNPDRFFALRPDGSVDDLGEADDYTASLALDPSGQRFFYVPGAHGGAAKHGTPLIAVDTRTGEQTEIVRLNDLIEPKLDLTVGGSYNVAVDDSGRTVYVGLNAGPAGEDESFGEVVLAVVHLS